MKLIADKLLAWYKKNGRQDLPWRSAISPYRVWLSEIMLQQTQVKTVISYFNNFTVAFPTVHGLANADEDEVLHLWSGLGYYSRARNLHKTAKIIHDQFNGIFPAAVSELEKLPGIGRSTAGAIAAIALNQTAPILDGNVKRVLTRLFAWQEWPGTTASLNYLWQRATELTPKKNAGDYAQAIMDLGATICTRSKPKCEICPLQFDCEAVKLKLITTLPKAKPKKALPEKATLMLIIKNQQQEILLEKRPPIG